eukprot:gene22765-biopygen8101
MQSRATLWEELLRGLISLLRATNFSSDIKLDDFVCMAWALRVMVLLGKEYCDSDSASLIACLEEKSEEYFRNFHLENFQVVRMMIDAEMWNHIPVQLQGKGAILGSIRQSFGARKVDAAQERRSLSKAPRSFLLNCRFFSLMKSTSPLFSPSRRLLNFLRAFSRSSTSLRSRSRASGLTEELTLP